MIKKLRNWFTRNKSHNVGFFAIHPTYMPCKKHISDAGYDIKAHTFIGMDSCDITSNTTDDKELNQTVVIHPGGRCLVNTGVWPMIESHDIEIQVRPRSGLALKHGISVVNSPGTVDSGYRDEIGVIIINHGALPFTINTGDRIAQLVICKLPTVSVVSLDNAPPRVDRVGGFGHTGVK